MVLYSPKKIKGGSVNPIAAIRAQYLLPSSHPHWSIRNPNEIHTLKMQINVSNMTTAPRFVERGHRRINCLAKLSKASSKN